MAGFEEIATYCTDALQAGEETSDPDYVIVSDTEELEKLCDDIAGERGYPIVGLTLREYSTEPVLRACDIRTVVGRGVRIYLVAEDEAIDALGELLGRRLSLWRGAIRIWWPGACESGEPSDHPLIVALQDEDFRVTLDEFADEFELSRPRVHSRVKAIEDARTLLARELAEAREQNRTIHEHLRDSQIECHALRERLARLEAGHEAAPQPELG